MRLRKLVLVLVVVALVALVAACGSLGQTSSGDEDGGGGSNAQQNSTGAPDEQVAPDQGAEKKQGETVNAVEPPQDTTMKITIPKMAEIDGDEIPTGLGNDETLFRDYAAVHLLYTGYPWEEEANVYIAGHRLGYDNTESYRAFYDLEDLKKGDKVYIEDSEGRQYTYDVFDKFIVEPTDLSVLAPVEGKNIVTLQTCTLPDYSQRVIVRAELEDIKET
jgi:sortase A